MTNIPRRKIYEEMLKYEDILIEMQILNHNEKNFEKFKNEFNSKIPELEELFISILSLFIMFLENKKYSSNEEFEKDIKTLKKEKENLIKKFEKKLPKEFTEICKKIEKNKFKKIQNLEESKNFFKILDKFNNLIPEMLLIRRDENNQLIKK